MESYFRALLYQQLKERQVAYNPIEPEPFDLVDLTRDVTNSTRIYHERTACVREALAGASLIVADSQALANAVQQVLPRAVVVSLPFGPFYAAQIEPNPVPVVGLLNHTGEMEQNNHYALKLLKSLKQELLVYGQELPGIEGEVEGSGDFSTFAARCDILLLPSLPGVINSTTLPLTLMASKTAILAHSVPGYGQLSAATGVQLLPHDAKAWRSLLAGLLDQPAKLKVMQERNQAYAVRQNRASYAHLAQLAGQFVTAPLPPRGDCGCSKKLKAAPTQPDQDQPIIEKES
ncbi:MAG: hypothetical protein KJ077_35690 [Anaerolineae bacterium]|nr:hypothetical protein [Anaerolineae bacterium]